MPYVQETTPGSTVSKKGRLMLVSNRLPVTLRRNLDGKFEYHASSGGLVSGLTGLLRSRSFLWYGWPGLEIHEQCKESVEVNLLNHYNAVPVWLNASDADLHYNGFSNLTLWPLLHHRTEDSVLDEEAWNAYYRVNKSFAHLIARQVQEDDIIWIHDYHLFLVPQLICEALKRYDRPRCCIKVGFFFHTPFPTPEVFLTLPMSDKIIESLLFCDLIGFHTDDYLQNFLNTYVRFTGVKPSGCVLRHRNRSTKLAVLPIGIDSERFTQALSTNIVLEHVAGMKRILSGQRLICGVDRLDYIKGIPQKLRAFERFLTFYPEWLGKVSLIQVVVPSRETLTENKALKLEIDQLATGINNKYKTLGFMPVVIVHRNVSFEELVALYAASDVCVITSLRDGMNLVSNEYVASQQGTHGVLVLSEFAGAAQLLTKSILINPHDLTQVAQTYHLALTMEKEERRRRWQCLFYRVQKHSSVAWGEAFMTAIDQESFSATRRRSEAGMAGQDMSQYYAS